MATTYAHTHTNPSTCSWLSEYSMRQPGGPTDAVFILCGSAVMLRLMATSVRKWPGCRSTGLSWLFSQTTASSASAAWLCSCAETEASERISNVFPAATDWHSNSLERLHTSARQPLYLRLGYSAWHSVSSAADSPLTGRQVSWLAGGAFFPMQQQARD